MNNYVNVAIQVLPKSNTKHAYDIVDKAIELIKQSGLIYQVCPFETVVEGNYDDIMKLVKEVQEICYKNGAEDLLCYLKIQSSGSTQVTIDDKMKKYKTN
jgi:uncharacterized protein YqgV (UPF0045/DUF77 family)